MLSDLSARGSQRRLSAPRCGAQGHASPVARAARQPRRYEKSNSCTERGPSSIPCQRSRREGLRFCPQPASGRRAQPPCPHPNAPSSRCSAPRPISAAPARDPLCSSHASSVCCSAPVAVEVAGPAAMMAAARRRAPRLRPRPQRHPRHRRHRPPARASSTWSLPARAVCRPPSPASPAMPTASSTFGPATRSP